MYFNNKSATPLHKAARVGDIDTAKRLLIKKTFTNMKDSSGRTPLYLAAKNGKVEFVKLLFTQNDINIEDNDSYKRSPLLSAVNHGHLEVVKLFLDRISIGK